MDVIDSAGKIFHRLVLTDSPAVHSIRYNMAKGGVSVPPVQNSIGALKNNALPALADGERALRIFPEERIYNMSVLSNRFDDIAFIKANRHAMTPTQTQLWNNIQEIIQAFDIPDETASNNKINTKHE